MSCACSPNSNESDPFPVAAVRFQNLESFSLQFESAFYANSYFEMNPGGHIPFGLASF